MRLMSAHTDDSSHRSRDSIMDSLYRVIVPMQLLPVFEVIDEAIASKRSLPALMLCYSTMDIAASLQRRADEGTRKSFERWIDTYVLPRDDIRCTSTDLYAARCGILHTLTAEADLIKQGFARRVVYGWGNANPTTLDAAAVALGRDQVTVHVESLRDAAAAGVNALLEAAEKDPNLAAQLEKAIQTWFVAMPTDVVDEFLHRRDQKTE